ncbi:M24 family metallopeptidase [Rhizorhabdus sp. FW153]|uniref:M24 family metallopeptidase n=1 Tax=Rhizorhabdus sp. FW153 TaxID=3400216 RepID=UPI003CF16753
MIATPKSDDDALLLVELGQRGPINIERALAVMGRHGLDGIVLGQPVNVFHALGHWPQIARTRTGQPAGTFALLARGRPEQWGLVTSRFLHQYSWADGRNRDDVGLWLYEALGDDASLHDASGGGGGPLFTDRGAVPLSPVERHRAAIASQANERPALPDSGAALVAAMRDLGLWSGRIGYDEPVIAEVCRRRDHPGEIVPALNALCEIRLIKSDLERRLMARAAAENVAALDATGRAIRAGATHRELQDLFRVEAALRGNSAVFLNVDRVSADHSMGRVVEGQTLMLDGVSHFLNYHGDFARTVFVGEPPRSAARAAEAAAFGWQAVRERLRPGLRYSEICAIGADAVRKAGFDTIIGFGPHSVGLAHTDEPGEDHGGFWRKPDIVLEAGMILSVDCPVMDIGIGGSAHCEDLVLITDAGCEPIHPLHDPVIIL